MGVVALASAAQGQKIATLVGDLQHLIGTCGDWSPPCADSALVPPTQDSFYRNTFNLPDGYYEYKIAIDKSWNENYGKNGVSYGPNIPLFVPVTSNVTFYWDSNTKWIFDSISSPFYYLTGSLQTAVGCKANDDVDCLAASLLDPQGTGVSSTVAKAVPEGTYTLTVRHTSTLVATPADRIASQPFTVVVPAGSGPQDVAFSLTGGKLTYTVGGKPSGVDAVAVKDYPTAIGEDTGPKPVETLPNGCVRYGRDHFTSVPVRLGAHEFRGNVLYGQLKVQNLGFQKSIQVIAKDPVTKQFSLACDATYGSGPYQSNFEVWKFYCPHPANATQAEFYVSYSTSGNTHTDGTPEAPKVAKKVAPWKLTKGFQRDISHFFQRNAPRAKRYMLENISPKNASRGAVVAAPAKQSRNQNYFYHWIRDASLTMNVVNELYMRGDKTLEATLWDHATFTRKLQNLNALTGLGEPKFNADGTLFNDPWCRPQNDGPAFRSSLFIRFAKAYLANGGDASRARDLWSSASLGVIKPDLDYIAAQYRDFTTCDLWEEQS
ncbi:glycoside hydrolase 15 protein, partial [Phlyctochytrium bullatum]